MKSEAKPIELDLRCAQDCLYNSNAIAKRLFLLFVSLLFVSYIKAQCAENTVPEASDKHSEPLSLVVNENEMNIRQSSQSKYWKRHKIYKACAWTSLSVGVAATALGFLYSAAGAFTQNDGKGTFGEALFYSGLGVTAVSVPLFILAHKNKVKARKPLSFSLNITTAASTLPFEKMNTQPACGISLNF